MERADSLSLFVRMKSADSMYLAVRINRKSTKSIPVCEKLWKVQTVCHYDGSLKVQMVYPCL